MAERTSYFFEELDRELARPPLAAQRAMAHVGISLRPAGWAALSVGIRRAIAFEGSRNELDKAAIKDLVQQAPARETSFVAALLDPSPDKLPPELGGPAGPLLPAEWRVLAPLDRYVLALIAPNRRLLRRALDEIASARARRGTDQERWLFVVGSAEIRASRSALASLGNADVLDGRALVLARAAGVRAARRIGETLDAHSATVPGPIEIDAKVRAERGALLWQAHVSTWDGGFFPAASLLAATTAAVASLDVLWRFDAQAVIATAAVREEAWHGGGLMEDEATALYGGPESHDPG